MSNYKFSMIVLYLTAFSMIGACDNNSDTFSNEPLLLEDEAASNLPTEGTINSANILDYSRIVLGTLPGIFGNTFESNVNQRIKNFSYGAEHPIISYQVDTIEYGCEGSGSFFQQGEEGLFQSNLSYRFENCTKLDGSDINGNASFHEIFELTDTHANNTFANNYDIEIRSVNSNSMIIVGNSTISKKIPATEASDFATEIENSTDSLSLEYRSVDSNYIVEIDTAYYWNSSEEHQFDNEREIFYGNFDLVGNPNLAPNNYSVTTTNIQVNVQILETFIRDQSGVLQGSVLVKEADNSSLLIESTSDPSLAIITQMFNNNNREESLHVAWSEIL